jgi:hypothetical protein
LRCGRLADSQVADADCDARDYSAGDQPVAVAFHVGTADLDCGVLFSEVFSVLVYDLVTRYKEIASLLPARRRVSRLLSEG